MVRHTAIVFVQLIIAVACFGQQQAFLNFEDNPVWGIEYTNTGGNPAAPPLYFGFLHSYSDTITMCGYRYDVVDINEFDPITGYVRTLNERVFLRATTDCQDKEFVMYDFGVEIGDTVHVAMGLRFSEDTFLTVVDDVYYADYAGVSRKTVEFGWMKWIEGIGSNLHPFYPLGHLYNGSENESRLLCVDSLEIPLLESECDSSILYLGIQQEEKLELAVYPNPSYGPLQISLRDIPKHNNTFVQVINSFGALVFRREIDRGRLDISNLPTGTYLVSLISEAGFASKKVVIVPPE